MQTAQAFFSCVDLVVDLNSHVLNLVFNIYMDQLLIVQGFEWYYSSAFRVGMRKNRLPAPLIISIFGMEGVVLRFGGF